jgi:Cu(I)/Ag(I) efflux system membrane fusion protein
MMMARGCLGALLSLALVASACAPSAGKAPDGGTALPSAIIDPYLEIQKVLADDSTASIKANAASIAAAATALGAPAMKIDSAALQLSAAAAAADPDIADVREKFGLLSEAIDAYMTGLKLTPPAGVHVAFCPMANKPWMQKGEALANPYYGKEMATCGTLRQ